MQLKKEVLNLNCKTYSKKLQNFIKAKVKELNRDGAIFGLSGGLDSSLTAALCAKALGKKKVLGLMMPEKESSPQSLTDAKLLAKQLNIKTKTINITPILKDIGIYKFILSKVPTRKLKEKLTHFGHEHYKKVYKEEPYIQAMKGTSNKTVAKSIAYIRTKHRARMLTIFFQGESNNLLIVGSANKTEKLTGLFTKFGIDHNADIMPLGKLYRTQLLQLAEYHKVPQEILTKSPK